MQQINDKLKGKTLAIIEPRKEYKRDKTWSFWKVFDHNFEDCVIKSWNNFTINSTFKSQELNSKKFPYQSIDSGLFYKKVLLELSKNKNRFAKSLEKLLHHPASGPDTISSVFNGFNIIHECSPVNSFVVCLK